MLVIKNATLVMPDHLIPDASIITNGGKIVDFGKKLVIPDGAEVIDAGGLFVGPGLIDIHTHSSVSCSFSMTVLYPPVP